MSVWGVTPDEILDHWTEELFALMFEKRAERIEAERLALRQPHQQTPPAATHRVITDQELLALPWAGGSYTRVIVPKTKAN